ncbi:MAG TPA: Hsp70 family protein, partial [Pirellulales bacterium]|nr:Hsp70 family protein [Pirellulales bacterium]
RSIRVQIVEGESASPEDCSQLGKVDVRDLPNDLPAGTPIEVKFKYAENGRLTITVKVDNADKEARHEITRENSLTPEQLDTWRQYVRGTMSHPQPVSPS